MLKVSSDIKQSSLKVLVIGLISLPFMFDQFSTKTATHFLFRYQMLANLSDILISEHEPYVFYQKTAESQNVNTIKNMIIYGLSQ